MGAWRPIDRAKSQVERLVRTALRRGLSGGLTQSGNSRFLGCFFKDPVLYLH
jgi:hypothetical protein